VRSAGVLAVVVTALLIAGMAAGMAAGPVALAAAGPLTRCALDDPRLDEVSGLAVTPSGPAVVGDSGNATVVYTLGPDCAVASARPLGVPGRDVEDLARDADGTLWLADIGDNRGTRASVALIRVPVRGAPDVRRLVYPDRPHDAETLLMPADGRPVILTKDLGGRSEVYTTDAPPTGVSPTSLRRVGELVVPLSATEGGPLGLFGRGLVTGGALSADGRVAAVRTYTDAWLYPVTGATAEDVVAALRRSPVDVPLPREPQGEAIAFAPDGTLLSAGEAGRSRAGVTVTASLRAVPGAASLVPPATDAPPPAVAAAAPPPAGTRGPGLLAASAAGAAALVVAALPVVALLRRRRALARR
jgi:hypothetical protein